MLIYVSVICPITCEPSTIAPSGYHEKKEEEGSNLDLTHISQRNQIAHLVLSPSKVVFCGICPLVSGLLARKPCLEAALAVHCQPATALA